MYFQKKWRFLSAFVFPSLLGYHLQMGLSFFSPQRCGLASAWVGRDSTGRLVRQNTPTEEIKIDHHQTPGQGTGTTNNNTANPHLGPFFQNPQNPNTGLPPQNVEQGLPPQGQGFNMGIAIPGSMPSPEEVFRMLMNMNQSLSMLLAEQ